MKTLTYEQQAIDFLQQTGVKMKIEFSHYGRHFEDDIHNRDIYNIAISRGKKRFSFKFGASLSDSSLNVKPNEYDILACLEKYYVGDFEDFCNSFGYDEDSRRAYKAYKAVCKEYSNVCKIWSDEEIELLQEIN